MLNPSGVLIYYGFQIYYCSTPKGVFFKLNSNSGFYSLSMNSN